MDLERGADLQEALELEGVDAGEDDVAGRADADLGDRRGLDVGAGGSPG
ncbi:MAG: hypothetical protein ABIY55_06425 [Kofleriaceae bacterium]